MSLLSINNVDDKLAGGGNQPPTSVIVSSSDMPEEELAEIIANLSQKQGKDLIRYITFLFNQKV